MEQHTKGLTLADGMFTTLGGPRTAGLLKQLDAATSWEKFAALVKLLYRNTLAKGGRPNVTAVVMLYVTLMQRWFELSDPAMEEAILDCLSFPRLLEPGTAVDATILEAPKARPRKNDDGVSKTRRSSRIWPMLCTSRSAVENGWTGSKKSGLHD